MHEIQQQGQIINRVITPGSISETLQLLAELGPSARIIAGGTDIILELARNPRASLATLNPGTELNQLFA